MTYAVGCGLSVGEGVAFCGGALDEMSTAGCRSHTMSILSSEDKTKQDHLGGMDGTVPDTVAT
jgi:hypothetical protein